MSSPKSNFIGIVFLVFVVIDVNTEYVTYMRTADNRYEPVMEAVSSTVEAVPLYKLAKKFSYNFEDLQDYEKNQLITVSNIQEHRKNRTKILDQEKHYVKVEPLN